MTVHLDEVQQESIISAAFRAAFSALSAIADGVRVVFVGRGHSMSVLIMCETRTGLTDLVNLYVFGKLESKLQELFTSLLITDDRPTTTAVCINKLVWELADYCRCYRYFNALPKCKLLVIDQNNDIV